MSDIKTVEVINKSAAFTTILAGVALICFIAYVIFGAKPSGEVTQLRKQVDSLTHVIDSLDKHIAADTVRINTTREVVKIINRNVTQVRDDVSKMPPNELAETFRDSALKYDSIYNKAKRFEHE